MRDLDRKVQGRVVQSIRCWAWVRVKVRARARVSYEGQRVGQGRRFTLDSEPSEKAPSPGPDSGPDEDHKPTLIPDAYPV